MKTVWILKLCVVFAAFPTHIIFLNVQYFYNTLFWDTYHVCSPPPLIFFKYRTEDRVFTFVMFENSQDNNIMQTNDFELPVQYIHTYLHTYIHTYVYTYIHTYVHTYIHIFFLFFFLFCLFHYL